MKHTSGALMYMAYRPCVNIKTSCSSHYYTASLEWRGGGGSDKKAITDVLLHWKSVRQLQGRSTTVM